MNCIKLTALLIALALAGGGCEQHNDVPAEIKPTQAAQTPGAVRHDSTPEIVEETIAEALDKQGEIPAALLSLYETLNMRSFASSFGPRLKYYCESYMFEYFPLDGLHVDSPTQMTLVNDEDTWVIEILPDKRIRIENIISGQGSYYSSDELQVEAIMATNDVRAGLTWIEQRTDCKPLHPDKTTVLNLRDHRPKESSSSWVCGDFWSGRDVSPELDYWKGLPNLAKESNPARHSWGPLDMLMINVRDHASLNAQCSGNKQLRKVVRTPFFDQPEGKESGTLVRIATFGSGLLGMVGYVSIGDEQSHKVYFDTMRKEQAVLLFSQRRGDWINIAPSQDFEAWINVQSFNPEGLSIAHLPYLERLATADEIKILAPTPHNVHQQASSASAVLFTLSDARTAMTPLDIRGDWMHVKFVPPPDYPLIGCGDDPDDYTWVSGWIQWRDGAEWFVTEEHHYGC